MKNFILSFLKGRERGVFFFFFKNKFSSSCIFWRVTKNKTLSPYISPFKPPSMNWGGHWPVWYATQNDDLHEQLHNSRYFDTHRNRDVRSAIFRFKVTPVSGRITALDVKTAGYLRRSEPSTFFQHSFSCLLNFENRVSARWQGSFVSLRSKCRTRTDLNGPCHWL